VISRLGRGGVRKLIRRSEAGLACDGEVPGRGVDAGGIIKGKAWPDGRRIRPGAAGRGECI
jgi:hypothetical protein